MYSSIKERYLKVTGDSMYCMYKIVLHSVPTLCVVIFSLGALNAVLAMPCAQYILHPLFIKVTTWIKLSFP